MIKNENTAKYKSKKLALDVVELYKYLTDERKEFVLSKQLLRSGTSIGANLAESECAISEKDFLNKIYVALKECNETLYWLDLLYETKYLEKAQFEVMNNDCTELKRMLSATTKTLLKKQNEEK